MTMPVEVLRRLEKAAAELEAEAAGNSDGRPSAEGNPLRQLVRGLSARITRLLRKRRHDTDEESAHE